MATDKVLVLGGGGRVGLQITAELLRAGIDVCLVDILPHEVLQQRAGRTLNDSRLAVAGPVGELTFEGSVDALQQHSIVDILQREQPQLLINYAIPVTWDATKRLPNYAAVSAAGLGAFTPIQVVTPLAVSRAIAHSGVPCRLMVGNLPDITIPIISNIVRDGTGEPPVCGAGNVALNQVAFRRQIAMERGVSFEAVELKLVSHHVHWVAPREPGYSNQGPFLARVCIDGEDVSSSFGNLRACMNRGVTNLYEPGAAFSSTTGILASRVALALLDRSDRIHQLHAPAPNGLPGGYPISIGGGEVQLDLPEDWSLQQAVDAMQACHALDGVAAITDDGTVLFTDQAQEVLQGELQFELPAKMTADTIEATARAQIAALERAFGQE